MWVLFTVVLLTMARVRASEPEIFYDDFNDGVWNGKKWEKEPFDEGNFREQKGRLYFYSNPSDDGQEVSVWVARFRRVYDGNDDLDLQLTVRVPHKIPTGSGDVAYGLLLGLYESRPLGNFVAVGVYDFEDRRRFVVHIHRNGSDDLEWLFTPVSVPTDLNAFRLRIFYSASRDKLNFYCAPVGSTSWTKIFPGLSLKTLFNRTVPHTMRPFVAGQALGVKVPEGWNVYLDDFLAVYRNLP